MKLTKIELEKRAWREAAALLENEMDAVDLAPDIGLFQEDDMREFIRVEIVAHLRRVADRWSGR